MFSDKILKEIFQKTKGHCHFCGDKGVGINRTALEKHDEENKSAMSRDWIIEERTEKRIYNHNINGEVSAKLAGIGKK